MEKKRIARGLYAHETADGKTVYRIERMVGGVRYHVSTRASSLRAAIAQLERFEADPANFSPGGTPEEAPLRLTPELIEEFYEHEIAKPVTPKHARANANYLADWLVDLEGKDLRKVTLRDDVQPRLKGRKSRGARIAALKVLYAWLRKVENRITRSEDCTLDLPVPQSTPEKWRRRKAVEIERVRAAFPHLGQDERDCVQLLVATGWHVTELERFAREDASEIRRTTNAERNLSPALAVLTVLHKGRKRKSTSLVTEEHVAAAERLRGRRAIPRRLNEQVRAACRKAEVAPFTLGVMRHSVATWAKDLGAAPEQISSFLGHESTKTTERYYIDSQVAPAAIPTHVLH